VRTIRKKIWPEYFDLIASEKKKYELRLADFEVAEGDVLRLEEWNPGTKQYTGRAQDVTVTMVRKTKNQQFWSADDVQRYGFQILQIEPYYHGHADAASIKPGRYEHYKGNQYRVLGSAQHSETGEWLVVYEALSGERGRYARPLAMFSEEVEVNGKKVPRFRFVGE
jgi:hypothetical protein